YTVAGPSGKRVARDAALGDALIERVGGDGVPDTLRRRRGVVNAVAAADDRFIADPIRKADAWREVVFVGKHRAATHAVLIREGVTEIDDAGIEILEGLVGRYDEAPLLASLGIDVVRIEVGDQVVLVGVRRNELVTQAQVDGKARANFPGVLNEVTVLPVANVHRRARLEHAQRAGRRQAEQEGRKGIRAGACVSDRAAGIAAVERETVDGGVTDQVTTHAERVLAFDPGERVAEGHEIL